MCFSTAGFLVLVLEHDWIHGNWLIEQHLHAIQKDRLGTERTRITFQLHWINDLA